MPFNPTFERNKKQTRITLPVIHRFVSPPCTYIGSVYYPYLSEKLLKKTNDQVPWIEHYIEDWGKRKVLHMLHILFQTFFLTSNSFYSLSWLLFHTWIYFFVLVWYDNETLKSQPEWWPLLMQPCQPGLVKWYASPGTPTWGWSHWGPCPTGGTSDPTLPNSFTILSPVQNAKSKWRSAMSSLI